VAQKTVVTLVDDVDGTEDENIETVRFSVNGVSWEMDLNPDNLTIWNKKIGFYIEHARRAEGIRGRGRAVAASNGHGRSKRSTAGRERSADIRAWAKENGHNVSERGRIPAAIEAEYDSSH
jgi:Lsr2